MKTGCVVVVGVGPGLGRAVAERFAREGYDVALVARSPEHLEPVAKAVRKLGARASTHAADTTEPAAVSTAYAHIRAEHGDVEVLVYNAGAFVMGEVTELNPDTFEQAWRTNCFGAFLWSHAVLPAMRERKGGTLLFTGATASLRGSARFSALAVGKFGLRALAQSLARENGPHGIHVAHVVIDGMIDTPRVRAMRPHEEDTAFLQPDDIAEEYWRLHAQRPSAWTLELDLRPSAERF